ncbi:hypothetical protein E4T43_01254 [Aureobasidium subglaciale]|nr:hypothetical protein E4T43_01254 [Aureobasidium subglaciale]
MSEPTPQQKANLARIRSRARRKEYLQELETKYRSCEAVGAEASAEIQAAARKVLDENKRLRRLLRQQGFSDADIDGPEHDEFASSPLAAEMLDVMLVTRKPCRPSSGSGCGDNQVCKTEDEDDDDDMDSRRQSVMSAHTAGPVHVAPQQQKQQHQPPIALAPAPAPAPAPVIAPLPKQLSHQPMAQQRQPQHVSMHPQQQQQHAPLQNEQHMQFQGQPSQHQHVQSQQQQPQFFMSPPSHTLATPVPQQNAQTSPGPFVQDYPIYAPQPFGYGVPQSQLLDWDMAAVEGIPQAGNYATPGHYPSPTPGFSNAMSYASPTQTSVSGYHGQDNTSSCFTAADAIRTLHVGAGAEVETALGCRDNSKDCRVDNTTVFDLMDHYSGVQSQQGGM